MLAGAKARFDAFLRRLVIAAMAALVVLLLWTTVRRFGRREQAAPPAQPEGRKPAPGTTATLAHQQTKSPPRKEHSLAARTTWPPLPDLLPLSEVLAFIYLPHAAESSRRLAGTAFGRLVSHDQMRQAAERFAGKIGRQAVFAIFYPTVETLVHLRGQVLLGVALREAKPVPFFLAEATGKEDGAALDELERFLAKWREAGAGSVGVAPGFRVAGYGSAGFKFFIAREAKGRGGAAGATDGAMLALLIASLEAEVEQPKKATPGNSFFARMSRALEEAGAPLAAPAVLYWYLGGMAARQTEWWPKQVAPALRLVSLERLASLVGKLVPEGELIREEALAVYEGDLPPVWAALRKGAARFEVARWLPARPLALLGVKFDPQLLGKALDEAAARGDWGETLRSPLGFLLRPSLFTAPLNGELLAVATPFGEGVASNYCGGLGLTDGEGFRRAADWLLPFAGYPFSRQPEAGYDLRLAVKQGWGEFRAPGFIFAAPARGLGCPEAMVFLPNAYLVDRNLAVLRDQSLSLAQDSVTWPSLQHALGNEPAVVFYADLARGWSLVQSTLESQIDGRRLWGTLLSECDLPPAAALRPHLRPLYLGAWPHPPGLRLRGRGSLLLAVSAALGGLWGATRGGTKVNQKYWERW